MIQTPDHKEEVSIERERRFSLFPHIWCDGEFPREPWTIALSANRRPKQFDVPYLSVLKAAQQLSLFVDMDPETLGGIPRIKDTRVPVYRILNAVEEYGSIEAAANVFRALTKESVMDALRFAANVLESPIEHDDPDID